MRNLIQELKLTNDYIQWIRKNYLQDTFQNAMSFLLENGIGYLDNGEFILKEGGKIMSNIEKQTNKGAEFMNEKELKIREIAQLAHEINRAYCEAIGDFSQVKWEDAPDWQKKSAINGVIFHLENENVTPEQSQENQLKQKETEGWTYGKVKDVDKREHPCFLPYNELPQEQKVKDYLFKAVVQNVK